MCMNCMHCVSDASGVMQAVFAMKTYGDLVDVVVLHVMWSIKIVYVTCVVRAVYAGHVVQNTDRYEVYGTKEYSASNVSAVKHAALCLQ